MAECKKSSPLCGWWKICIKLKTISKLITRNRSDCFSFSLKFFYRNEKGIFNFVNFFKCLTFVQNLVFFLEITFLTGNLAIYKPFLVFKNEVSFGLTVAANLPLVQVVVTKYHWFTSRHELSQSHIVLKRRFEASHWVFWSKRFVKSSKLRAWNNASKIRKTKCNVTVFRMKILSSTPTPIFICF